MSVYVMQANNLILVLYVHGQCKPGVHAVVTTKNGDMEITLTCFHFPGQFCYQIDKT